MDKSEILYLNPNYLVRHDETRSLLCARNEREGIYSKGFFSFIHPHYAELLTLFDGENTIEEVISKSYLGKKFGNGVMEFIEQLIENPSPFSTEGYGTKFVFPINLLLCKKGDTPIEKGVNSCDFSFQELDFKTQKLSFPLYLTLMVNTICYTDCIYCYADCRKRKKRQIPIEKIMELFDEIEQNPILDFTIMGGEFFMEEHWELILSRLHQLKLYPTISTKIPISEDVIKRLHALGVEKLQISLDSINPKVLHRLLGVDGERYLSNMQRTLSLLKEYGIQVKVNSLFTNYNDDVAGLHDLLGFLSNYSVYSVTVIPAGFSMYKPLDYMPSREAIERIKEYVKSMKSNYDFSLSMASELPKECMEGIPSQKEKYFSNRSLCTGNLWQAFIMPNGDVTFCEGTMSHPAFVLGNMCQKSFKDVWKAPMPHLLNQKNYQDSVCGSCPEFEDCHLKKGVCWKYIIQGYGGENVYYPDPRCPKAPKVNNRIY